MRHDMISAVAIVALIPFTGLAAERGSLTPFTAEQAQYMQAPPDPKEVLAHFSPVISHIVYGGTEWQTTFIFHNPSDFTEKFTMFFYGDDGEFAEIPMFGGMYSGATWEIPARGTDKFSTDYSADVPDGWCYALVIPVLGNFTNTYLQSIFKRHIPGQQDSEATVFPECPLHTEQVLIFDQEDGYVMGVAIANPWERTVIKADVYDVDGRLVGARQIPIGGASHEAFALSEMLPETAGRVGSVVFTTNGLGFSGLGLRFSPNGSFTSMPMVTDPRREPVE